MELRGAYGYENLQADVRRLAMRHRFVRTGSAGRSVMGRQLPLIRMGTGPRGYASPSPLSEPEASAMAELTRAHNFGLVIAFHSQGEVIYWGYGGHEPPVSEGIVGRFASVSGYQPIRYAGSGAGYKDWFIQEFGRPGFTVEVGRGVNPLPVSQFEGIWQAAEPIMWEGLQVLAEEV